MRICLGINSHCPPQAVFLLCVLGRISQSHTIAIAKQDSRCGYPAAVAVQGFVHPPREPGEHGGRGGRVFGRFAHLWGLAQVGLGVVQALFAEKEKASGAQVRLLGTSRRQEVGTGDPRERAQLEANPGQVPRDSLLCT